MCSEFSPNGEYSFGRGSRIVLTYLLGENYGNESGGNYEACTLCNGTGCDFCEGYLSHYNINNPIIVVTGHSLGAAVSNIFVHELNQIRNSESGIYGYTLSGVSSIIGVIIVLLNKIASYLFPPQEDQEVLNLIKQLQKSDEEYNPTCENNCPMFDEKYFK